MLGAFRSRLEDEPLLVVPRMDDVDHHQRELAGDGAMLGGHVVRFSWLFEEIAGRRGYSARRASRLQVELIAEQAVRHARLEVMAASAARPGFARAAVRLFAELERSRVEPAAWRPRSSSGRPMALAPPTRARLPPCTAPIASGSRPPGLVDADLFAWRALDPSVTSPSAGVARRSSSTASTTSPELELEALETLAARSEADVTSRSRTSAAVSLSSRSPRPSSACGPGGRTGRGAAAA